MDKPLFDKGLVLPDKLICLSKTRVSNARGSPRGMLMHSPRGLDKIANAPSPGLTTWANAPRLPGGGGDGHCWNWLMHKHHSSAQCILVPRAYDPSGLRQESQPFWNNKGNNRIPPIRFTSVFTYGACPKWLLPELSIPAAGQKDRRLWGRECCPVLLVWKSCSWREKT